MKKHIEISLKEAVDNFTDFANNNINVEIINEIAATIANGFNNGKKVLICGNGGSSTDAMHFAEELTGKFRKERRALPAISITDPSHITGVANDYGFDEIFARGVEAYGKESDVLIAISTSGNSPNVIKAVTKATNINEVELAAVAKEGMPNIPGMDLFK